MLQDPQKPKARGLSDPGVDEEEGEEELEDAEAG